MLFAVLQSITNPDRLLSHSLVSLKLYCSIIFAALKALSPSAGAARDEVILAAAGPILEEVLPTLRMAGSKYWRNLSTFLDLLHRYALLGSQFRHQLLELQAFDGLLEYLTQTSQWSNGSSGQYKQEHQPLWGVFSLLVRSTSLGDGPAQSPMEYRAMEADPAVDGKTELLPSYPSVLVAMMDATQHTSPVALMANACREAPDSLELRALRPLLCYIASGQESINHSLCSSLMTALDQSVFWSLHGVVDVLKDLILLDDGLRMQRAHLFHFNPRQDRTIVGTFAMLNYSRSRAHKKVYFLLRFYNWELSTLPDVKAFLMSPEALKEWKWGPQWLKDKIDNLPETTESNHSPETHTVCRSPSAVGLLDSFEVILAMGRMEEETCYLADWYA